MAGIRTKYLVIHSPATYPLDHNKPLQMSFNVFEGSYSRVLVIIKLIQIEEYAILYSTSKKVLTLVHY